MWVASRADSVGIGHFRPCPYLLSQNPQFKNKTWDSYPPRTFPGQPLHCEFPLSFPNSLSLISRWQVKSLILPSVHTWSIWPEQRPGNNGCYYYFNEFKALFSPHMTRLPLLAKKGRQSPLPLMVPDSRTWELPVLARISLGPGCPWVKWPQPMVGLSRPQIRSQGSGSALKHNPTF